MKLLIVAGGGGHFVAALAVIQSLPKEWEVVVVGRKYVFEGDDALSLEYQTCHKLGIPFETLTTGRLQRKFSVHTIKSLLKIPGGLNQARKIIQKYKPEVVLSFGGYVSVPVVLIAAFFRKPIVIHEQTHHAGLANKIGAKFAKKICISWSDSRKFFPADKIVLTGNPLRKEFLTSQAFKPPHPAHVIIKKVLRSLPKGALLTSRKKTPTIYITGGSQGAHGINVLIEGCLSGLLQHYHVIHQTGDAKEYADYDRLHSLRLSLSESLQQHYELHKFIDPGKVADILTNADLVISRSGINTVTELLYLGKPTIFIPLPFGQHNEQQTNAAFVKAHGLAEVVDQNTVSSEELEKIIHHMMQRLPEYKAHAETARKLVTVSAAENIVEVVRDVRI